MVNAILGAMAVAGLASAAAVTSNDKATVHAYNALEPPCTNPFTPFSYRGCYDDTGDRVLPYVPVGLDSSKMTPQYCQAACKSNNFKFSGVEYYDGEMAPRIDRHSDDR